MHRALFTPCKCEIFYFSFLQKCCLRVRFVAEHCIVSLKPFRRVYIETINCERAERRSSACLIDATH